MRADVLTLTGALATDADFASVFNAHHRKAVRLAWLLTSDHHQAEDIVSDAFLKVYPRWREGAIDDVGAYLRRAVVNGANSKLRRRYVERREAGRERGDDRGVRLLDEQAADRDAVWQAVQTLPDRMRAVVVLRFYEDLGVDEVAEVLGVSPGTVKSQNAKAMAKLQAALADVPATSTGPSRSTSENPR